MAERNWRVVLLSLLALACMVLTFSVNWMFIALAALLSGWGWWELTRKK